MRDPESYWTEETRREARAVFDMARSTAPAEAASILASYLRAAHPDVAHEARQWLCSEIVGAAGRGPRASSAERA